jgi:hypothetical protein
MKKITFITCLFLSSLACLHAQKKSEFQFGLASPTGSFADDNADNAIFAGSGYAAEGLYVGYKMLTPLSTRGLYWTLTAGATYNQLSHEFGTILGNTLTRWGSTSEFSLSRYLNFPVTLGLQYEIPIAKELSLFGEAGLGGNLLKITDLRLRPNGDVVNVGFYPSIKVAYKLGGGVLVNDKYTLHISYAYLGAHKQTYTLSNTIDSDSYEFDKALPVSTLNLAFGIRY